MLREEFEPTNSVVNGEDSLIDLLSKLEDRIRTNEKGSDQLIIWWRKKNPAIFLHQYIFWQWEVNVLRLICSYMIFEALVFVTMKVWDVPPWSLVILAYAEDKGRQFLRKVCK
jgi:hypothetical protein